MPRATQLGKTKGSQKLHTATEPKHVTRKTPSGVVLVLRGASLLSTENLPTLPSVIQSVSKQLEEILQLCPCDSSGTVWAEAAPLFSNEDLKPSQDMRCSSLQDLFKSHKVSFWASHLEGKSS